jgi:hypothetical protein
MTEHMKNGHRRSPSGGEAQTAAYIADLATELAALARGQGFQTLAYLLDMAKLEADGLAGPPES